MASVSYHCPGHSENCSCQLCVNAKLSGHGGYRLFDKSNMKAVVKQARSKPPRVKRSRPVLPKKHKFHVTNVRGNKFVHYADTLAGISSHVRRHLLAYGPQPRRSAASMIRRAKKAMTREMIASERARAMGFPAGSRMAEMYYPRPVYDVPRFEDRKAALDATPSWWELHGDRLLEDGWQMGVGAAMGYLADRAVDAIPGGAWIAPLIRGAGQPDIARLALPPGAPESFQDLALEHALEGIRAAGDAAYNLNAGRTSGFVGGQRGYRSEL